MTLRIICDLTSIGDLKQHFLQVMQKLIDITYQYVIVAVGSYDHIYSLDILDILLPVLHEENSIFILL